MLNTIGAGDGTIQCDDQGGQFQQLHDHLCHIVIECYDITLGHGAKVYLNGTLADQEDGGNIN